MKIAVDLAKVLFLVLLLFLGCTILEDRYEGSFGPSDSYPYSTGNAPEEVRSEILATLKTFQDGYERRGMNLRERVPIPTTASTPSITSSLDPPPKMQH